MHCHYCEFENPAGMKYCGQCGRLLTLLCLQCQFENPVNFKYCGHCAAPLITTDTAVKTVTTTAISESAATDITPAIVTQEQAGITSPDAERRQITVVFCDVVDSSSLSEHIDPEDLRDILRAYRDVCDAVVQRFNGHIAQYLGDGVLIYFGFPHAHEDDAHRAAQTGLALIDSITSLNQNLLREKQLAIEVRIGIHTGLVVVGGLGGGDKRSMALGETPNIAARLQDLAQPNTVIVSANTYRLIHHDFVAQALGEHKLKGFSRPYQIFQLLQESDKFNQQRLPYSHDQTPLIGREQEGALLLDRLEQARSGAGQVVLLSGEAGIGKTRLTQYLSDQIKSEPHYLLKCCGSPYYQHSYLHSAIGVLKRFLDLDNDMSLEEKIKYLEQPLAAFGLPLSDTVPLLADLLGIAIPEDRYPALQLTPLQQKQKTIDSLLALIMAMSSVKPVFIIIEDLQWVDPTTLELIGKLIDQIPTSKVFALLTFRPEFSSPWVSRSHLSHITINRLTRKQTGRMIRRIANNKRLPIEIFQEIVSKTDGTPFFIEELTKMVLESDWLREGDEFYELTMPIESLAIPSTLQDSLMARLDRLGPEKELAQLSATLGREFGHSLLKAVASQQDKGFDTKLHNLVNAELLYQHGLPPIASYTFRHALVHEVAYQSLLKKTRQQYHQHISHIIITQFPQIVSSSPEIVAHHCTEAGNYAVAIQYWIQAGKSAIQHFALIDAVSHLRKGLEVTHKLDDAQQAIEFELLIQPLLGLAYIMNEGYGSPNVEKSFQRAYQLCKQAEENTAVPVIISGLWEYYVVRAELDTAHELAQKLLSIARQTQNDDLRREAERALGSTFFWQGNYIEANKHLESGLNTQVVNGKLATDLKSYSQDPQVANLANACCVLWLMGFPGQALKKSVAAIELANTLHHSFSQTYAAIFTAIYYQLCGEIQATRQHAQRSVQLSEQYDFGFWKATGMMLSLWVSLQENPNTAQIQEYESLLEQYRNSGSRLALSYFTSLLIDIYLRAHDYENALRLLEIAIRESEERGVHFFEAELYRLKAIALAGSDPTHLESIDWHFQHAIDIARQQNANGLELRACTSLARRWQANGRLQDAETLLSNSLQHFTEGFVTRDIQQAQRLLEEIKYHLGSVQDHSPVS